MLAREIFYHFSEENGNPGWLFGPILNLGKDKSSSEDQVSTSSQGNPTTPGTDAVGTTERYPDTSTSTTATSTTTDPSQSSYRIPILSRFNGNPSQSNSQSVLNAGLPITTPSRRV